MDLSSTTNYYLYSFFFFFFPKETKEQFRGSIDFEEVFALGNFPSNEERNKSSRTFSSSLIFVIVNAPRFQRNEIPSPLKKEGRCLLSPSSSSSATRKIFTWSINESRLQILFVERIDYRWINNLFVERIDHRWIDRYRESIVKRDMRKKKERTIYMDQKEGRSNN